MIEIETDVPLPRKRVAKARYRWHEMKVGDSFFVEDRTLASVSKAAYSHASYHDNGTRWTCRPAVKNGVAGVRVWRLA